jgi:arginine/lysine/ornithine decarboxylase
MNRALIGILTGLVVGLVSHSLYFQLHLPAGVDSQPGQLAWMKEELKLSDEQFERIKELHDASSPRLRALAVDVARMQEEFAAFERSRQTSDQVDFIEFARFVETRRTINRECLESTRQLVLASASVMTPVQRVHYLGIVATAEPFAELN